MIDAHRLPLLPRSQPAQKPRTRLKRTQQQIQQFSSRSDGQHSIPFPRRGVARRVIDPPCLRMRRSVGREILSGRDASQPSHRAPLLLCPPPVPLGILFQPFFPNPPNVNEEPIHW